MMKKIIFSLLILSACNPVDNQNVSIDLQRLSTILPTANWQIIANADTSYIYFSQQFDNSFKTYEYKLLHGDSSVTWSGGIRASGDSVFWDWNNHSLRLEEITDSKANWKEERSGENYVLQKINDTSMQIRSPAAQWRFTKTLPLSTFLVRAKYDYEHGTKLLDSAEVPPKKLVRLK